MSVLLNYPKFHALNDSGTPLVGGLLYTYVAGSSTNKATYSDYNLATANTNPVVLDRRGEATVYGSGFYKFVLKDSAGNTIWTEDNLILTYEASVVEINTGTETDKYVSPDKLAGSNLGIRIAQIIVINFTTDCAIGNGKAYFRINAVLTGMNLVSVAAACITAGTTGTMDIQIANVTDTTDMLSTVITIDSTETDSKSAAAPAVIDTTKDDVVTGDILRVDIDAVHTTAAKGLIVEMGFQLP